MTDARRQIQEVAELEEACRERGMPLTVQRRAVFAELVERRDHPTAEQVYEAVRGRLPGLSRTTVYRVLDTLVELGAARRVLHAGAAVRYDPVTQRHHHLVCEACGRLEDVADARVPRVSLPNVASAGFAITGYSVSFTGICSSCRDENERKKETWPRN